MAEFNIVWLNNQFNFHIFFSDINDLICLLAVAREIVLLTKSK
jgi:hypothetical protein